MNDLKIEYVDIKKLRPFAGNPRRISDEGLKKLERSIGEFGFVNPVLCWRNGAVLEVIAGHQRLKAAEEQGIETVPVVILPFDDWHQAYAYNIADNRLQDESEWDYPKLKDLIAELDDGSLDIQLSGFDIAELEEIMVKNQQGGEEQKKRCPQCGYEW